MRLAIFVQDITLLEAETIALSILKQVMEEKVKPNAMDIDHMKRLFFRLAGQHFSIIQGFKSYYH